MPNFADAVSCYVKHYGINPEAPSPEQLRKIQKGIDDRSILLYADEAVLRMAVDIAGAAPACKHER